MAHCRFLSMSPEQLEGMGEQDMIDFLQRHIVKEFCKVNAEEARRMLMSHVFTSKKLAYVRQSEITHFFGTFKHKTKTFENDFLQSLGFSEEERGTIFSRCKHTWKYRKVVIEQNKDEGLIALQLKLDVAVKEKQDFQDKLDIAAKHGQELQDKLEHAGQRESELQRFVHHLQKELSEKATMVNGQSAKQQEMQDKLDIAAKNAQEMQDKLEHAILREYHVQKELRQRATQEQEMQDKLDIAAKHAKEMQDKLEQAQHIIIHQRATMANGQWVKQRETGIQSTPTPSSRLVELANQTSLRLAAVRRDAKRTRVEL